MSSSKSRTAKEKRSSIGSGIFGIVRRKSRSKRSLSPLEHCKSNEVGEAAEVGSTESFTETIEFKTDFFGAEEEGQLLQEAQDQLQKAQSSLAAANNKNQEDEETIEELQIKIKHLEENDCSVQSKLKEMAEGNHAEVLLLKQQIEDLNQQLQKKQYLDCNVQRLTDEVAELQTQNQELRFQQERSSTRSRIHSINEEKNTKEEILRLQKELRMAERNMKMEMSSFEDQLKAAQDGNERLQDKIRISKSRYDELDKERLDMKIEINRLQKKLEKTGSYVELKRLQTEQESAELELKNLKRKNLRLERQLGSGSNQALVENGHDSNLTSNPSSLRFSLSHQLEKEVAELEATVTKMKSENKKLEEKAGTSQQTTEVLSLKVKQLDDQLQVERNKIQEMEVSIGELKKAAAGSSGEEYLESLLKKIGELKQASKDIETKFRVKEKDLWSTIEAQKKKIEDIEMEKLALELGEDVEGSDAERESTPPKPAPQPAPQASEKVAALQSELDGLRNSEKKLEQNLQAAMQQLEEASKEKYSLEKLRAEIDNQQTKIRELQQANENLQKVLKEGASKSEQLEEISKTLETSNVDLSKKLEEAKAATEQVPSLKRELEKLKKQVKDLQKSGPKGDVKKVSFDEISVLKKDVEKLTDVNARITKDLESAEDEIDRREDTNVKLEEAMDKLKKEKQKLKADLVLAEDELEKVDAEVVQQTGKLLEQISQLKKENVEVSYNYMVMWLTMETCVSEHEGRHVIFLDRSLRVAEFRQSSNLGKHALEILTVLL